MSSYGYNNAGPALPSNMSGMQPQPPAQPPYEVSGDYVDSTTTYEPKQTGFLDADFISHGQFISIISVEELLKITVTEKSTSNVFERNLRQNI